MYALSPEETKRFLSLAEASRWFTLFQFALVTGMRPEGCFGLRWENINWQNGRVQVKKVLVRATNGGGWRLDEPKTKKSCRSIPILQNTHRIAENAECEPAKQRLSLEDKWNDNRLVFAAESGEPIHIRT